MSDGANGVKADDAGEQMRVRKRSGDLELVDVTKILRAVERCAEGIPHVNATRVATKTIGGLFDGASTRELDMLAVRTAADLIAEEVQYGKLAARLLAGVIWKEVRVEGVECFHDSVRIAHSLGLASDRLLAFVTEHRDALEDAVAPERDAEFEYFGVRTLYDRYLLKHPTRRTVIEATQHFFLRIACALSDTLAEALELYGLFSRLEYLPSSPTLFNAGTCHEQLSSCFLVDSPLDSLDSIYQRYAEVAALSKFSGGIGIAYHRVRCRNSLIASTNGHSRGIVPWLRTLDSSVAAVNQGGKRSGACAVYLETWHADIEQFLELRDNTGDPAARTYNLNLANWVSDLFMRRVEADAEWSLFDPKVTPDLPDLYGADFDARYEAYERAGAAVRVVKARDLYAKMMRTLAQTGNGWMTFKDRCNLACNQTARPGRTVHLSNLCVAPETRILVRYGDLTVSSEEIALLAGADVEVWNGREWSRVTVKRTAQNVELVKVRLSNGVEMDCTPEHRFAVATFDSWELVAAQNLQPGARLAKFDFPVADRDETFSRAQYVHGFFCGDGTYEATGRLRTTLYGVKRQLSDVLDLERNARTDGSGRVNIHYDAGSLPVKFAVPHHASVGERLSWFAGLVDSDGCLAVNNGNESLQVGSVNLDFLRETRLMLTTLGVDAKVTMMRPEGEALLPDGRGGQAVYPQQPMYRLLITSVDTHRLYQAGLRPRRVLLSGYEPQRDARQFTRVVSVTWEGRVSDTYCFTEPKLGLGTFNGVVTGQCTEIVEVCSDGETAVCNLGSINLGRHVERGPDGTYAFDFGKLARTVRAAVRQLDRVIDANLYTLPGTRTSNMHWRPVGLGQMGLQDVFFLMGLPFDSAPARALSRRISEEVYYHAVSTSADLAASRGPCPAFPETRTASGWLQFDAWGVTPSDPARWDALRERVVRQGMRNSLLVAIAPTATIASIVGCYECIEPQVSNLFKRETLSGDFMQVNRYLAEALRERGLWTEEVRARIKAAEGSVSSVEAIPEDVRHVFRTAWEIPMRSLIDMAADRGAFIDQSQSLNLFVASPNVGRLSAMYFYAWKAGLKSTYYLRSRPATRIARTDEQSAAPAAAVETAAVACSLENPGSCEACQ